MTQSLGLRVEYARFGRFRRVRARRHRRAARVRSGDDRRPVQVLAVHHPAATPRPCRRRRFLCRRRVALRFAHGPARLSARLRDALGTASESIDLPADVATVTGLLAWLARAAARGPASSHPGAPCASRSITTSRSRTRRFGPATRSRCFRRSPAARPAMTRPRPDRGLRRRARDRAAARRATRASARSLRSSASCATSTTAHDVRTLTLEHYPGMTEKALGAASSTKRRRRWDDLRRAGHPSRRRARADRPDRAGRGDQRASRRGLRRLRVHHGLPQDARAVLEEGSRRPKASAGSRRAPATTTRRALVARAGTPGGEFHVIGSIDVVPHAGRPLIAIDWGTSSARAYALDAAGQIVASAARRSACTRCRRRDFAAGARQTLVRRRRRRRRAHDSPAA